MKRSLRLVPLLLAACLGGCSVVAPAELGAGVGARCDTSSGCQGGICEDGICIMACQWDADCPPPSRCVHDACHLPLRIGAVLTGSAGDQEGWTTGHVEAMRRAADELGYVTLETRFGVDPGRPAPEIESLVAAGADAVIGDSVDYGRNFIEAAARHPDRKFLWCNDEVKNYGSRNATSYWVRRVQAWYVAGKLAAGRARSRLGVISAFINPETVRDINAFTLGARSVNPGIVVEVRYIGFWFDWSTERTFAYTDRDGVTARYFREEQLALQLMDTGCEIIAHLGNTQRSVRIIDERARRKLTTAMSFANDARYAWRSGSGAAYPSCLGSIYENWHPLYYRLFDELHRGVFDPTRPILLDINDDPADSPTGVSLNPEAGGDENTLRAYVHQLAKAGPVPPDQRVFQGPFATTGQRDANGDGQVDSVQYVQDGQAVSVEELQRMCWYVKGVVEKVDAEDPRSPDRDARVPGGLADNGPPPGAKAPAGLSLRCLDNIELY